MKKSVIASALLLAACAGGPDVVYRPAEQKLPQHIKRIAVRPFVNKTQQFGLEEKLTLKVIDEFLKNGEYGVVQESGAEGVVVGEITHYILTPIQYDVNLVPTVYKLNVLVNVRLLDREANRYLWEEPAMQATKMYSGPTLPGGLTEESAREYLWEILAKDIVKRTVEGFGAAGSASQKKVPGAIPEPSKAP
ncbi:MAG TPA: LptE family protein [Elusimicrobiales bacterium]|nr:LptE family protein [Elusimicrobiales bacterium]